VASAVEQGGDRPSDGPRADDRYPHGPNPTLAPCDW
jgi:hypothetical protein